jgi:predicted NBD/HSP70 family sugar kinase
MRILVVDVGGTSVKLLASGQPEPRKIDSSRCRTPRRMVASVLHAARDWRYDRVSLGYPGFVVEGRPVADPANLGRGWVGFDFRRAFGHPVRILNDAAMQAIGCYRGGRMLYLGLGTGLGAALVTPAGLLPMEIAHLPYRGRRSFESFAGKRGLARLGLARWRRTVAEMAERLASVLEIDDLVLGGGNASRLARLPRGARRVENRNAFEGGFRMWEK